MPVISPMILRTGALLDSYSLRLLVDVASKEPFHLHSIIAICAHTAEFPLLKAVQHHRLPTDTASTDLDHDLWLPY